MINTKLILIDGITGSGKSTTTQFLARQLEKNGIKAKWYHEEVDNHPLQYEEDVEVFESQEEMARFLEVIPELWREFVEEVSQSDQVHIIESFLMQNTIRLLFQNRLEEKRIIRFVREIEEIIRPLNPTLIYFYQQNVECSIRKIWKRRGAAWKKWFIDSDIQTPYVQESEFSGEAGVIKLWSDYQDFTNQIFSRYDFKKLSIENSSGDWDKYRQQIMDFLDLNFSRDDNALTLKEMKKYCGVYQERQGKEEFNINLLNNNLVCDIIWPDIRLIAVKGRKNYFQLESFPITIKFLESQDGRIKELSFSGKEKLEGRVFCKKSIGESDTR